MALNGPWSPRRPAWGIARRASARACCPPQPGLLYHTCSAAQVTSFGARSSR